MFLSKNTCTRNEFLIEYKMTTQIIISNIVPVDTYFFFQLYNVSIIKHNFFFFLIIISLGIRLSILIYLLRSVYIGSNKTKRDNINLR